MSYMKHVDATQSLMIIIIPHWILYTLKQGSTINHIMFYDTELAALQAAPALAVARLAFFGEGLMVSALMGSDFLTDFLGTPVNRRLSSQTCQGVPFPQICRKP